MACYGDSFTFFYTNNAQHILSATPSSKTNEDKVNTIKCNSSSMFLIPTTEMEVTDIIKGMGNKKSTAVDDIPEFIIKQ
jgi:hypothetical protein